MQLLKSKLSNLVISPASHEDGAKEGKEGRATVIRQIGSEIVL